MQVDGALSCAIAAAVANGAMVGATLTSRSNSCRPGIASGSLRTRRTRGQPTWPVACGGIRPLAGVVLLSTGAVVAPGPLDHRDRWRVVALLAAAAATVAHILVTARAAPTILTLRRLSDDDPDRIAAVLARFARLQTLRAGRQAAALAAAVWVLVATVATG
jgi:hypothetical protein